MVSLGFIRFLERIFWWITGLIEGSNMQKDEVYKYNIKDDLIGSKTII